MKKIILFALAFGVKTICAQNVPTFGVPQPVVPVPLNDKQYIENYQQQQRNEQQLQNERVINEELRKQRSREEAIKEMNSDMERFENERPNVSYSLPSLTSVKGTECYRKAFTELSQMANGENPIDIKRAVFLVENAYYGNTGKYESFNTTISHISTLCKMRMREKGYDLNNKVAKNMVLHQFISDTLIFKNPATGKKFTHYPMTYQFDDYRGQNDWSNMFVSKLLATNKGQCHSLPLLYLVLAQEIGTDAYLAYSPSHTYVKFKDNKGRWNNLELTNGKLTSDAFILESGYVKASAIKNNLYMDTLSKKQLIAHCMADLAKGYTRKFGIDEFVINTLDKALDLHPNNIYAMLQKSDYYTVLFDYVLKQTGKPRPEVLQAQYPEGFKIWKMRDSIYDWVDNSGYQEMPKEVYDLWLKGLEQEKNKEENERLKNMLLLEIKPQKD